MIGLKEKLSRADVDKIIAQGSEREKMLLYLTGIAEQEVEPYEVETLFIRAVFPKQGREKTTEPVKLTEEESSYLLSCIVSRKGIAQYNRMRAVHSRFLYFKEKFSVDLMRIQAIGFAISVYSPLSSMWLTYKDPENITEEDKLIVWTEAMRFVHLAALTATDCRYGITLFKQVLSKELPIKPYNRWVNEQEKRLITILEEIFSKTSGREDYPADAPQMPLWENIVVEVDPQDIEDFKLGI